MRLCERLDEDAYNRTNVRKRNGSSISRLAINWLSKGIFELTLGRPKIRDLRETFVVKHDAFTPNDCFVYTLQKELKF